MKPIPDVILHVHVHASLASWQPTYAAAIMLFQHTLMYMHVYMQLVHVHVIEPVYKLYL